MQKFFVSALQTNSFLPNKEIYGQISKNEKKKKKISVTTIIVKMWIDILR